MFEYPEFPSRMVVGKEGVAPEVRAEWDPEGRGQEGKSTSTDCKANQS